MTRELDFVDECYAEKDLSLLKKLTLVIPTFNRDYLKRCLWYHAHFPFGQIIVADSSFDEKKIENREIITKIREEFDANILHLEYQPETEKYGGDIYRKWADAVQHVNTEYSEICTDKEFVIPTVCCESILFLAENRDYVNAFRGRGDCIQYHHKKIITQTFRPTSGTRSDQLDRLSEYKDNQAGYENLFQIYRTNSLKEIWNNYLKYNIDDIRYGEVCAELQPLMMGKVKLSEGIGRVRDLTQMLKVTGTKEDRVQSSTMRYQYLVDYPEDRKINLQKQLTDCLCSHLPQFLSPDKYVRERVYADSKAIMQSWMGGTTTHKQSMRYRILVDNIKPFWNLLPIIIKKHTLKYFKKGLFAEREIMNRNDITLVTILNVICMDV